MDAEDYAVGTRPTAMVYWRGRERWRVSPRSLLVSCWCSAER
jgi:hypothetical protein